LKNLIEKFYAGFSKLDAETMSDCYHSEIEFEDPAFGKLSGDKVKNMWRMLCRSQRGKDFQITFSNISYNNGIGKAHWEAFYTFSKTGRKVHNIVDAEFEFEKGKIIKHTDNFDLHKWANQALGMKGFLLGSTSFFKRKLNRQTNKMLFLFELNLKK